MINLDGVCLYMATLQSLVLQWTTRKEHRQVIICILSIILINNWYCVCKGSVYAYETDNYGSTWSQVTKIVPVDSATGHQCGWSVAIFRSNAIFSCPGAGNSYEFDGGCMCYDST